MLWGPEYWGFKSYSSSRFYNYSLVKYRGTIDGELLLFCRSILSWRDLALPLLGLGSNLSLPSSHIPVAIEVLILKIY